MADASLTRREAIERVIALFGGAVLVDEDRLLATVVDERQRATAGGGVGDFTAADVALLDEVAETILPETSTPGAKAAKTGAFMALMVSAAYTPRNQQVFRDGMRRIDAAAQQSHTAPFTKITAAERLRLLERLDREQKAAMDARAPAPRSRAPLPERRPGDEPAHFFRMMKELALLGYFTSQIGCTQAQRYVESPGRFEPCVPHKPGEKTWAPHA
jgi:hypothetical protein